MEWRRGARVRAKVKMSLYRVLRSISNITGVY